jgi:hypothetical protein
MKKVVSLLFFCSLIYAVYPLEDKRLSEGYYSEKISVRFPSRISLMELTNITFFEEKNPGLGTGLSYRGDDIKADVYIYDMNFSRIPDGVSSEFAKINFKWSNMEIEELGRRGVYARLKELGSDGVKKISDTDYLCKKFSYVEEGSSKESFLYLTCRSGNFIKIRLTYNTVPREELGNSPTEFMETVSKLLQSAQSDL